MNDVLAANITPPKATPARVFSARSDLERSRQPTFGGSGPNLLREQSPDSSGGETQLSENHRVVPQSTQGGAAINLFGNHEGVAGHEPERVEARREQARMLLTAHSRTVGTDDKFTLTIAISSGAAGQPEVVAHGLASLIDEGVAVVDGADHVDGRGAKRHN